MDQIPLREQQAIHRIAQITAYLAHPQPVTTENLVGIENAEVPGGVRSSFRPMTSILIAAFALFASSFRTRAALQTEVFALRHQLAVVQANAPRRLHLQRSDRLLWILLSRLWSTAGAHVCG